MSDMHLDPAHIGAQEKTYSSLTDLNQIDLFESGFAEAVREKEAAENAARQELSAKLFTGAGQAPDDGALYGQLFTGVQQMTVHRTPAPQVEAEMPAWIPPAAGLVVTGCALLVLRYHAGRRKKRKRALMEQTLELQHEPVNQNG